MRRIKAKKDKSFKIYTICPYSSSIMYKIYVILRAFEHMTEKNDFPKHLVKTLEVKKNAGPS